jgi:hypothetical protein
MKAVTEFASFTLTQGLKTQAALAAEGKTPEEIQAGLGTAYKFEGEKLTHFINALDVASKNADNLKRVVVMSLNEGENAPAKAVQVEAHYYVPESLVMAKPMAAAPAKGGRGGPGGRGGKQGGPKSSPWGMSPEEKAAKNKPKA